MLTFEKMKTIETVLEENFGFSTFRKGQKEVISKIVSGQSAGAIFPTGSGKSLCYQLSAIMLPHLSIVVSPLLALIEDQIKFLTKKGIKAVRIDSTLSPQEYNENKSSLQSGAAKILFISVERFNNEGFRLFIKNIKISLLVIDEAHCISEWGHNFRPDYLKLPSYQKQFNIPQVLLLTATASPNVVKDMGKKFNIPTENIIVTGFHRPNLHIKILPTAPEDRLEKLASIVSKSPLLPTIVYVTLQKTAEEVSYYLNKIGILAKHYHAGLKNEERSLIQENFMQDKFPIIIATIAFGMGIDKTNIRRVIHFDIPKSIENYSQEIGRAGRDGNVSQCIMLANGSGTSVLENFVYGDTPEKRGIETVLNNIAENTQNNLWEMKTYQLSKESNIRQLPLKTLLVYLEQKNIILPAYVYFSEYRFKAIIATSSILSKMPASKHAFVKSIFNNCRKGKLWYSVLLDNIISENVDRNRILTALNYFDEKGWIKLEAKSAVNVFNVKENALDVSALSVQLHNIFLQKEINDINRLDKMIALFKSEKCISKLLTEYFGESLEWTDCGTCSSCLKESSSDNFVIKSDLNLDIAEFQKDVIAFKYEIASNYSDDLIAKFFCGIKMPSFRAFNRKPIYKLCGKYEETPYQVLLDETKKLSN